jgi:hypothetical protein
LCDYLNLFLRYKRSIISPSFPTRGNEKTELTLIS